MNTPIVNAIKQRRLDIQPPVVIPLAAAELIGELEIVAAQLERDRARLIAFVERVKFTRRTGYGEAEEVLSSLEAK